MQAKKIVNHSSDFPVRRTGSYRHKKALLVIMEVAKVDKDNHGEPSCQKSGSKVIFQHCRDRHTQLTEWSECFPWTTETVGKDLRCDDMLQQSQ